MQPQSPDPQLIPTHEHHRVIQNLYTAICIHCSEFHYVQLWMPNKWHSWKLKYIKSLPKRQLIPSVQQSKAGWSGATKSRLWGSTSNIIEKAKSATSWSDFLFLYKGIAYNYKTIFQMQPHVGKGMPLDMRHGFQIYQYNSLYYIRLFLSTVICNSNHSTQKRLTDQQYFMIGQQMTSNGEMKD